MKKVALITMWIIIIGSLLFLYQKGFFTNKISDIALENPPEIVDQSNQELKDILESDGDRSYQDYIALGNADLQSKKYKDAIKQFLLAGKSKPTAEALFGLGNAYLGDNQAELANKAFVAADKVQANSIDIQLGISQSLLDMRQFEEAKTLVWKLNGEDPRVQYYKGIILILVKDYEAAHTVFGTLADEKNQIDPAIKSKAQIFLKKYELFAAYPGAETIFLETLLAKGMTENGQFQSSIPLLFDVINTRNNYRDAWIILGYAYLNSNKIPDAIDSLNKARNLDPEKPETFFFLGLAYSMNNNVDTAIKFLEKARTLGYQPKDELNLKLGDLYLLKEEYEKSSDSYEEVLSINQNKMEIFTRYIWLNIDKLDRPEKALEIAQIALKKHPDDPMSFNLVGWAYVANNEFDKGEEYLNQAIALYPKFDAAYLNLGLMYEKKGNTKLAGEYYNKALKLGKGNTISSLANKRLQTNTLNN